MLPFSGFMFVIRGRTKPLNVPLSGLTIFPTDWGEAFVACVFSALAVALYVVAVETVFPHHWPRVPMWLASLQTLREELIYRLVLMTLLAALFRSLGGSTILAIILAQLAAAWPWLIEEPLYATLRFWLPGLVWGLLYWKHGWVTAATADCLTLPILDPLLS